MTKKKKKKKICILIANALVIGFEKAQKDQPQNKFQTKIVLLLPQVLSGAVVDPKDLMVGHQPIPGLLSPPTTL